MEAIESHKDQRATDRKPFLRGMRGTLLALFLLLALVPMALVSILSYTRAQEGLTESAKHTLSSVMVIQKNILLTNFRRWESDILFCSRLESLKSDIVDMATGFKFLGPERLKSLYLEKPDLMDAGDGSAFSAVHLEEHRFFKSRADTQQYEDILLIDLQGNVIYSEKKGSVFGKNLTSGPYEKSNLAELYKALKTSENEDVRIVDAAIFEKGVAVFMGVPIKRGNMSLGYLVIRLPMQYITERLREHVGMGSSFETYLVGPDHRLRSDSFNDPEGRAVMASFAGTVEKNGVDTEAVREALAGNAGVKVISDYRGVQVLSAYAPVEIKGLQWVIISEVDKAEALAAVLSLRNIMIGLICVTGFLVLALSFFMSGRIVRPIQRLTGWARKVAVGDLSLEEINAPRNEIGVLNQSFKEAVKSLRTAKAEQKRQNWLKTGRSELDDLMRGEQDLGTLCGNVVTFISKYCGAQVGAFFINDDSGIFKLMASYAYRIRKNLSNEFRIGEGLVGQAALEKQSILLTNVPDDYVAVTSGLGEKQPKNILVNPLVYNDAAIGVIEIGSFEGFSDDHRGFLDETGERIAIAASSATARHRLRNALDEAQRLSEELQVQQEELKTSNEELEEQTQRLQASEEKLKAQQEELQVTNEELEEKNDLLERQKQEVERARRDIEEKAGELALASKYKSEFLANMSHELRTPLNSLLLLAQSLSENKEGNLTENQLESVRIIHGSGSDLLDLINEILDLSKIEAGRMDVHLDTVLVSDLAEGVRTSFQHVAENKGLDLEVAVRDDAPSQIISDRKRVEQVIRNLVSNAVKFTEKGSVTVTFGRPVGAIDLSRSGLAPGQCLAVAVKDTGIGVALEQRKIIFEAFQQADGGTARKYVGTGLGLTISRELANLVGGEIQLESELGKGSIFTLYLPIKAEKKRSADPGTRKEKEHTTDREEFRPKTANRRLHISEIPDDRDNIAETDNVILVIEDDVNFVRVLSDICHQRGFKCLVALTGEMGLELATKHLPRAIILDIYLPGMDGWAVLTALKDDIRTRHIPVHVVSAEEATTESLRKGAVGHATKPINREELEKAFKKLEEYVAEETKCVLMVEDDDGIRRNIKRLIGDRDVKVDEAVTGQQAIEALRASRYGCLILDLSLPDMDGTDLLKRVKAEGIELPPVIVHTSRELTRQEEMDLRESAESIVIKDVRSHERLLDEVSLFLHRMISKMPEKKRQLIMNLHETDVLLKDKKVLIVDDDMRTLFAVSRLLSEHGIKPLKADNGERAIVLLKQEPDVDLVLMDIMMPVMDGYEAMKQIRAQDRFHKLPIIALTAKAMPEDREKCIAAGASDYLPKPVDHERLISMLRVWLYR